MDLFVRYHWNTSLYAVINECLEMSLLLISTIHFSKWARYKKWRKMTSFSKWLITSLFAKVVWKKKLLKDFFCSCVASKVFLKSSFLKRLKKFFPRKRKWSFSKRSSIEDRFQFLSKNVLPSSRKMHWKLNLIHEDNKKERSNWILFSRCFYSEQKVEDECSFSYERLLTGLLF